MQENKHLTITALTSYIKYKFDNDKHLKNVLIKGEISNFKHHSRGHFYLKLKDDKTQISAIMFSSNARMVDFEVKDGMSVIVEGHISVFEGNGQYVLYIKSMKKDGIGNLHEAFEKLKIDLHKKGLFNQSHKLPLPKFPRCIGVQTSETGAAVKDIINTINRRFPLTKILIYKTLVQGQYSKNSIIDNIKKANQDRQCDVLIIGRGGGSIEDLWSYNEEEVAYAIYESKIPIISAVGHEIDFTISDYVADLRAPTPTAAAELAVPNKLNIINDINQFNHRLNQVLINKLKNYKNKLKRIEDSYVFKTPDRIFANYELTLNQKMDNLNKAFLKNYNFHKNNYISLATNFKNISRNNHNKSINSFQLLTNKLELLNPLKIMKKGFSLTKVNDKILNSVKQIKTSDEIEVNLSDGMIYAKVEKIKEK